MTDGKTCKYGEVIAILELLFPPSLATSFSHTSHAVKNWSGIFSRGGTESMSSYRLATSLGSTFFQGRSCNLIRITTTIHHKVLSQAPLNSTLSSAASALQPDLNPPSTASTTPAPHTATSPSSPPLSPNSSPSLRKTPPNLPPHRPDPS